MRYYFVLLCLCLGLISFSQMTSVSDGNVGCKYQRISMLKPNDQTRAILNHIGIDLTCGAIVKKDSLYVEVDANSIRELKNHNIDFVVIISDLEHFYSSRADDNLPIARLEIEDMKSKSYGIEESVLKNLGQYNQCEEIDWQVPTNFHLNPNNSPNSFGGCLTYAQVLQELDEMRLLYPHLISVKLDASPSSQTTVEGRTLYYVRISDNPDIDEPNEPETLYQSLIHSREASSVMQLLYFMWYLLEHYDNDEDIKSLLNNQALYFIPVFNPDGFTYNEIQSPNGGGLQRKNRNVQGTCSTFLNGVDLNRNSAYYWGNGGASSNQCAGTYMGAAPFSENETQIMRDFFLLHDFKLALNHHSYKNAMLHGYAGTIITNPRPDEYAKYSHDMSYYNRYAYGPSTSISYLNSGNMNDWMLGGAAGISVNGTPTGIGSGKHTLAWTPENGNADEGGFWPLPSHFVKIAKRSMRMNFLAAYYSGKYAKLHDLTQTNLTALTGTLDFGIENLGQTPSDFTITIQPISLNILSVNSPITESGIQVLNQNIVHLNYTLNSTIQLNDTIEFKVVLTNDYGTNNVLYEKEFIKIYKPNAVFNDIPDVDGITNWTAFGGSWDLTTDAYSGTTAITSTILPPYASSVSKLLELNHTFDLSGSDEILIQYYAKWDLERSFDYVQFEASIDGINWTSLCGALTKPGVLDGNNTYSSKTFQSFQPEAEPLYDGDTQGKWNLEKININALANSFLLNATNVSFRFVFNSDDSNYQDAYYNSNFEGFTFDDFSIINATKVNLSASLTETYSGEINMYPNPITDELMINLNQALTVQHLRIYQSNGQVIYTALNGVKNKLAIDTQLWRAGVYFVVVNGSKVYKVVKF